MDFQNLIKIEFSWKLILEILIIRKSSLGSFEVPQKMLGPIGLAALTFIRYKQINKQTPRQAKYIQ